MSNITDQRIISHEEWIEQRKALLWGGSYLWEDRLRARTPWRSEARKVNKARAEAASLAVFTSRRDGARRPYKVEQTVVRHYQELTQRAWR